LAPQHVLIVVDHCEHLIGSCAKIADAMLRRCPWVHLLATSREPLGIGGEIIYRVPSLSLPGADDLEPVTAEASEAVALFVDRAAEQGVAIPVDAHTAPLLGPICRRLDGMPLAIELAAARLRSLSLSELSDRLDQRFRLLTGGSRAALERQQTLHATVHWSYSLLSAAEQQLLRRLAVFAESFDLSAVEAVCGLGDVEPLEITDLLGSLVDKSLVQAEQAGDGLRYRLLETIRQFAAGRLVETGIDEATAVAAAHCEHFMSVADTAEAHINGPGQPEWLAPAGRRPGEPVARGRACGSRPGPHRTCAAVRYRTAPLLAGSHGGWARFCPARAGARATRRPGRPGSVHSGVGGCDGGGAHDPPGAGPRVRRSRCWSRQGTRR
jgi:predicted ATPase